MNPQRTALHATREDPTRAATDAIVISASLASLVGVGYLLLACIGLFAVTGMSRWV